MFRPTPAIIRFSSERGILVAASPHFIPLSDPQILVSHQLPDSQRVLHHAPAGCSHQLNCCLVNLTF